MLTANDWKTSVKPRQNDSERGVQLKYLNSYIHSNPNKHTEGSLDLSDEFKALAHAEAEQVEFVNNTGSTVIVRKVNEKLERSLPDGASIFLFTNNGKASEYEAKSKDEVTLLYVRHYNA